MDGPSESELIAKLRARDEAAFVTLVDRYHDPLRRLARTFVSTEAAADEVVQDTWVAVLAGIETFEERSAFKTWLFRILVHRAQTRGVKEARSVPASALADDAADAPAVEPARFDERGMWKSPPARGDQDSAEARMSTQQLGARLQQAIQALPERQRTVIVLRDVLGWTADEVCNVLEVEETNQRVLLHRARSRLRAMLEDYRYR
ncbi:MAG: sigma-70 family RNA polymerase sigma factor [Myxococcota bacterium]|nr:sigma-70 family RNA polymerase sigma factor [Myxococcota bacterium]